jgi:hypothetical protein
MANFSSLHFATSTGAPLFDVPTIYDNVDHPWRDAFISNIAGIKKKLHIRFRNFHANATM